MVRLEVMNPVAQVSASKASLAPRLSKLDGKKIGLYWNGKMNGNVALQRVEELLKSKFKDVEVKLIWSSVPGPKERVEEAKTFDAIIGSTGD